MRRLASLCLIVGGASSGCLILEPIEFDDRQLPSHLDSPDPFFTFTRAPEMPDPTCTGSGVAGMRFAARVSDANINEPLSGRLVVNGGLAVMNVKTFAIPATGSFDRGVQGECIPLSSLSAQCNRVELLVTSAWNDPLFPYGTRDPNDVARVEWWVLGPAVNTPGADEGDCADYLEGDVP